MDDSLIQRCLLHGKLSGRFLNRRHKKTETVQLDDAIGKGLKAHSEAQFIMRMRQFVDENNIKRGNPVTCQGVLKARDFKINQPQLTGFYSAYNYYRRILLLVWPDWCNPAQWVNEGKSQYCYSLGFSDSPTIDECPLNRQTGWWLRNFPLAKKPFDCWLESQADQLIGFAVNHGWKIKPGEEFELPYSVEFLDYIEPKNGLDDWMTEMFERSILARGDPLSLSPNSQDIIRNSFGSDWVHIHYDKFCRMKTAIEEGAGSVAKTEEKGKGHIAWNPIDEEPPQDPLV